MDHTRDLAGWFVPFLCCSLSWACWKWWIIHVVLIGWYRVVLFRAVGLLEGVDRWLACHVDLFMPILCSFVL